MASGQKLHRPSRKRSSRRTGHAQLCRDVSPDRYRGSHGGEHREPSRGRRSDRGPQDPIELALPRYRHWVILPSPMITCFEVKNFRSIKSLALPMRPFMVLVGPNGAGKTNVIQALALMGDLLTQG